MPKAPDICPVCGAEVPPAATACPQCGSDEQTGWSEQARYDGLDLPAEHFDYDDFVRREFGGGPAPQRGVSRFWWWIAIATAVGVLLFWL